MTEAIGRSRALWNRNALDLRSDEVLARSSTARERPPVLRCDTRRQTRPLEVTNVPTPTKTLRLRPRLRADIERMAKRARRSFSEVAQDLLEEAVRLRECPGIYFTDEPTGRVAKVSGTGLGVWEVIDIYRGFGGSQRRLRRWHPHLSPAQLKAALVYHERYREEVDGAIEENRAAGSAGKPLSAATTRRR